MAARIIEIEMGDARRMRRVVSRSNHRVTGKYPSLKKNGMAYWESGIEHDAFRRLDADSSVVSFREQPARIVYEVDGASHVHYPDILVERRSASEFVEVKSDREANCDEVKERSATLQSILAPHGFGYRVWPESEIRVSPRLANEIYLLRYGRHAVSPLVIERLRVLFQQQFTLWWADLVGSILAPNGLATTCRLILDDWLMIDRDIPIAARSEVRFNSNKGEAA